MSWISASPSMYYNEGISPMPADVDIISEMEEGRDTELVNHSLEAFDGEDIEEIFSEGNRIEGQHEEGVDGVVDADPETDRIASAILSEEALISDQENSGHYVLITKGLYTNHLARLNNRCQQSNRYSLTVLSDSAEELGSKSAKLTASSFEVLTISDPTELPGVLKELRSKIFSPISPSGRSKLTLHSKHKEKPIDGDDSTNNLYWVARSSIAKGYPHGYACLWYGGSEVTASSVIKVIPVCRDVVSSDSTNSGCETSLSLKDSSNEANDEISGPQYLMAMRCQLQPLDVDALKQQPWSVQNQFIAALLDFCEWDDYNRDTYYWPENVSALMLDRAVQQRFFERAENHALRRSGRPLSDVFLFLLLAEHLGRSEYFDNYVNEYMVDGQCTVEVLQLFDDIRSIREDFTTSTRRNCRVGANYQAADVECSEPITKDGYVVRGKPSYVYRKWLRANRTHSSTVDTDSPADSSPSNFSSDRDRIDSFLGAVQLLREKYLQTDQLIEAPTNLVRFRSRMASYLASNSHSELSLGSTPLMRYRNLKVLENFIAASRRSGYTLTALSTVKRVIPSHDSNSASQLLSDGRVGFDATAAPNRAIWTVEKALNSSDITMVHSCKNLVDVVGNISELNGDENTHDIGTHERVTTHKHYIESRECEGKRIESYNYSATLDASSVDYHDNTLSYNNEYDHGECVATHGVVCEEKEIANIYANLTYNEMDSTKSGHDVDRVASARGKPWKPEVIEILDDSDNDCALPAVIDLTESRSVTEDIEDALQAVASNDQLVEMNKHFSQQKSFGDIADDVNQNYVDSKSYGNASLSVDESTGASFATVGTNHNEQHQNNDNRANAVRKPCAVPLSIRFAYNTSDHIDTSAHIGTRPVDADVSRPSNEFSRTDNEQKPDATRSPSSEERYENNASMPATTQSPSAFNRRIESVVVYKGIDESEVPIECCRIFSAPDDWALDVLNSCGGDALRALRLVEEHLSGAIDDSIAVSMNNSSSKHTTKSNKTLMRERREVNLILMRPTELDIFHRVVNKYHNDLRKVYLKYNMHVKNLIAEEEVVPISDLIVEQPVAVSKEVSTIEQTVPADDGLYFFPQDIPAGLEAESLPNTVNINLDIVTADADAPLKKAKPKKTKKSIGSGDVPVDLAHKESSKYLRRTPKDICDLFFVFYPTLDEGKAPLQKAFNSGLFQQKKNYRNYEMRSSDHDHSIAQKVKDSKASRKRTFDGATKGYVKDSKLPNRWPSDLPLTPHSMYWIRTSNDICLCFGIKSELSQWESLMNVLIISADAYHRETTVPSSKLDPLTDDMIRQSNDDKVGNFAGALMDFAEWELSTLPSTCFLTRWYVYPDFIVRMLRHGPTWATWRKQAERNQRGLSISRRLIYFNSLKDDFDKLSSSTKERRYATCSFPWDDFPRCDSLNENRHEDDDDERKEYKPKRKESHSKRRKTSTALDGNSDIESFTDIECELIRAHASLDDKRRDENQYAHSKKKKNGQISLKGNISSDGVIDYHMHNSKGSVGKADSPGSLGSYFNLFWLPNSNLPCIYYDIPENRHSKVYMVKPFHCSTYYYPFDISSKKNIEPFKMDHLKHISCDRTVDFTKALVRFAQTIKARYSSDDDNDHTDQYFDWPYFVLNLTNEPQQWKNWRYKAERINRGTLSSRSDQYYQALLEDYDRSTQLEDPPVAFADSEVETPPVLYVDSYLNLFWLPRSELPCIYYDTPDNRSKKEITVLPICCGTYHYPTKVSGSAVTALSRQLLRGCREDRTHEFTEALIDFALAQLRKRNQTHDLYFDVPSSDDSAPMQGEALFDWPPFILKLVNSPKEWYVWRKRAERAGGDSSRKRLYYKALCEEYEAINNNSTSS